MCGTKTLALIASLAAVFRIVSANEKNNVVADYRQGMPVSWLLPGVTTDHENDAGDVGVLVVGGTEVPAPGLYPFFASWAGSCGGAFVHPDIVLTAAHCAIIDSNEVIINAYELRNPTTEGAELRIITDKAFHPEYNAIHRGNDLLLLKLSEPVTSVEPLQFNIDESIPESGQEVKLIGLGATRYSGCSVEVLREVTMERIPDDTCGVIYDEFGGIFNDENMICAGADEGGKGSCFGDSGGPLFTLTESGEPDSLVGIVSFGVDCDQTPGVFVEVSAFSGWIEEQICAMSDFPPDGCPAPTPQPTPGPNEGQAVVSVFTDIYPTESGWTLYDSSLNVIKSVPFGAYFLQEHLYETSVFLEVGQEYIFEMKDRYDGFCCGGSYSVAAGDNVLASGDEFGLSENTTFIMPPNVGPILGDVEISISVKPDQNPLEIQWTLFDIHGNLVLRVEEGYYNEQETVGNTTIGLRGDEEYLFVISDSGGNGLCCNAGEGYYKIFASNHSIGEDEDLELASGAVFGSFDTASFIVPVQN